MTMKIPTTIELQTGREYCGQCFYSLVEPIQASDRKRYECSACHTVSDRRISTDPSLRWWLDQDRNLWHESVGVFLFNRKGSILCFELTKFPFGLTIPAGHREEGETSEETARRELLEETGLHGEKLQSLGEADISGDSCSRGADMHRWHVFAGILPSGDIHIDPAEGKNPVWISLAEASHKELTVPVRYCLDFYKKDLERISKEATG